MGTRADFYVGRGETAEWIGSIAWDGYPAGIPENIKTIHDPKDFRDLVAAFLAERKDATLPEHGWPWPWEDSDTTDYAYAFDAGTVYGTCFGLGWWKLSEPEPDWDNATKDIDWPLMRTSKQAPAGSLRSGIIAIAL
jgi:hypothetical protein